MLINFIGAPCSGKSTTAGRVYAELKDQGYPAEFVPEQARRYIAANRYDSLDGLDQIVIMEKQFKEESIFAEGSQALVVADSSPLNSLLYMTNGIRMTLDVEKVLGRLKERNESIPSVAFLCEPVKPALLLPDPNRLHTWEQSVALHEQVKEVLAKYAPGLRPCLWWVTPSTALRKP